MDTTAGKDSALLVEYDDIAWWKLLLDALGDLTMIVLMVCAVISIVVNMIFANAEDKHVGSAS